MKGIRHLLNRLPGWSDHNGVRYAWCYLGVVTVLAVLGPWIANERPYYCQLEGQGYWPMFSKVSEAGLSSAHPAYAPVSWNTTMFQSAWRAPIPYSHTTIDLKSGTHLSPFAEQKVPLRFRHWLGTDGLGRDVLAGMIRGCRVSLLIGLGSMLLALLIGIPMGAAAAWWGNRGWQMTTVQWIAAWCVLIMLMIIWLAPLAGSIKWLVTLALGIAMCMVLRWRARKHQRSFAVPFDLMVMGSISITDGFPAIFLILILVAILPFKGWVVVMMTIALLRWPTMARYMRAEVFKMRETNYIRAARLLNIPDIQILWRHVIPYAFRPVMISFIFGVSSAILAESSLSFLGLGLPTEEINWGRLLAQSRNHFDAWWLVVFPGCAIFFTLLSLNAIGSTWEKYLKMKIEK